MSEQPDGTCRDACGAAIRVQTAVWRHGSPDYRPTGRQNRPPITTRPSPIRAGRLAERRRVPNSAPGRRIGGDLSRVRATTAEAARSKNPFPRRPSANPGRLRTGRFIEPCEIVSRDSSHVSSAARPAGIIRRNAGDPAAVGRRVPGSGSARSRRAGHPNVAMPNLDEAGQDIHTDPPRAAAAPQRRAVRWRRRR